jgi:hypothetical protein
LRLIIVNLIDESQAVLHFDKEDPVSGKHQYHFEETISDYVMSAKVVNGSP